MYKSDYGFLPLYFLGGIAMSFGILCICKWIEKGRLLSYIGKTVCFSTDSICSS